MKNKRILHITYGSVRHAPRVIHAGQCGVEHGYDVHVLGAPRESFPSQPTEETIKGMNAYLIPLLTRLHIVDMFNMLRFWLSAELNQQTKPMPNNRIKLRTAFNILLFNLWILRFGSKLKPNIIHCHELWGLPSSILLAKLRRVPIIYDVWDPYVLHYEGKWQSRVVDSMERFFSRRSDAIITASGRMKFYFQELGCQDVEYIGNWKRLSDYDAVEPERLIELRQELGIPDSALIVSYIGLLFESRSIPDLLQAMKLVPDIFLIIAGRGSYRQQVIDVAEQSSNIKWLDWIDLEDVPMYTRLSDVVYWCVEDVPTSHMIVANKLFETFSAGNVMLARYGIGEMSEILEETQAGYLIETVTLDTIAEALRELQNPDVLRQYKANSWAVRETYSWSAGEKLLLELYDRLLN